MPEPFFDDREIGATGEKPRGMRVTQIMNPDLDSQVRGFERRHPDVLAEPPAGNMPIGVGDSRLPGLVLASGPALSPVDSKRSFAVGAPAVAGVVTAERAV
jgi:hypothetical protein